MPHRWNKVSAPLDQQSCREISGMEEFFDGICHGRVVVEKRRKKTERRRKKKEKEELRKEERWPGGCGDVLFF